MKSGKGLIRIEIIITALQILVGMFFATLQIVPYGALADLPDNLSFLFIRRYIPIDIGTAGIFLQVDATILTLTIALIALIAGLLSESHMGISYSDYFLNIRPRIYRQVVIIGLSLFYFSLGSVCFWLHLNYLVAAVLFCEILLVLMSVISIYGIFGGNEKIKRDIENYSLMMQIGLLSKECSKRKRHDKPEEKKSYASN